jgi:hypothetical protein
MSLAVSNHKSKQNLRVQQFVAIISFLLLLIKITAYYLTNSVAILTDALELFVHSDGCMPFSCQICGKDSCSARQQPFEKRVEWNLDNIISDQKHKLV